MASRGCLARNQSSAGERGNGRTWATKERVEVGGESEKAKGEGTG